VKNTEIAMKNYMIIGTKIKLAERKAHVYSGTSNAIDSYEIPKSFKKNIKLCTNSCQFPKKCHMSICRCELST